jgi:hypothetical protein
MERHYVYANSYAEMCKKITVKQSSHLYEHKTITYTDYVKFVSQSKIEQRHKKIFALQVNTGLQHRTNGAVLKFWTSVSKTM